VTTTNRNAVLTARDDADIMGPAAWTRLLKPVKYSDPSRSIYGPGYNSFTVDERGRDMLVFHARDYEKIESDSLFDPNRHTRVQRIRYGADSVPIFQPPAARRPPPTGHCAESIRVKEPRFHAVQLDYYGSSRPSCRRSVDRPCNNDGADLQGSDRGA
jgi:hypothetical protein